MTPFSDRILEAADRCGHGIVLAFDPWPDRLPRDVRPAGGRTACDAVEAFGTRILEALDGKIAAIKFQLACFEALGPPGLAAYARLLEFARHRSILTIADAKRADIGTTARAYARAHLGLGLGPGERSPLEADAMTVVPFFGEEGVRPFLDAARERGRGVFLMVRSSNPGARVVQDVRVGGKPWYLHLAGSIASWDPDPHGSGRRGARGFAEAGFVVGATEPAAVSAICNAYPDRLLLLPGIGAQGASMADIREAAGPDREGLLPVIGRAVLYAYRKAGGEEDPNWLDAIQRALDSYAAQAGEPGGDGA